VSGRNGERERVGNNVAHRGEKHLENSGVMLFSSKKCVFCPQKGLFNHPFNKKKKILKNFENSY
jgi:hypothetical protein